MDRTDSNLKDIPYTRIVRLADGAETERAGLGRRLLARLLDGLIIGVVNVAILSVTIGLAGSLPDVGSREDLSDRDIALFGIVTLVSVAFIILYEILMISRLGATVGKRALGIQIINHRTGNFPSAGRAFGRWILLVLPWVNILVLLSILFYDDKRGWHDRAFGTTVLARTDT